MPAPADPEAPTRATPTRAAPTHRAKLRALLIAVVLLVECTSALPDRKLEKRNLDRPEVQSFVHDVDRTLAALRLSPGPHAIERWLRVGSSRLARSRQWLLRPFEPLFQYTATGQQWGLFLLGTRECFRVHVEVRGARSDWSELYRAPGQGPAWIERLMRYRRLRGIYNPRSRNGPHPQYPGFVHALAQRVFAHEHEWIAMRVRMERLAIGAPGTAPESRGFEHEIVVMRDVRSTP